MCCACVSFALQVGSEKWHQAYLCLQIGRNDNLIFVQVCIHLSLLLKASKRCKACVLGEGEGEQMQFPNSLLLEECPECPARAASLEGGLHRSGSELQTFFALWSTSFKRQSFAASMHSQSSNNLPLPVRHDAWMLFFGWVPARTDTAFYNAYCNSAGTSRKKWGPAELSLNAMLLYEHIIFNFFVFLHNIPPWHSSAENRTLGGL